MYSKHTISRNIKGTAQTREIVGNSKSPAHATRTKLNLIRSDSQLSLSVSMLFYAFKHSRHNRTNKWIDNISVKTRVELGQTQIA